MARPLRCAWITVLAVVLTPAAAASASDAALERAGVRDIVVVRAPGLTREERGDLREDAGVTHGRALPLAATEVVRAPEGGLVEALAALRADPDVRRAEADVPVRAATDDPGWPLQWALENTGQEVFGAAGSPDADIDAPKAWTASLGTGVTVAVVDTGVQLDHPDLTGQITGTAGEQGVAQANGIDDDHDGYIDDFQGWDWVGADNTPQDGDGHGTHVGGLVAAKADNTAGVAGVAPGAKVMPLRVLDDDGEGSSSDVASAFAYAGDAGVRVVNASLASSDPAGVIRDAIGAHPDTLYVVAAGNDHRDNDQRPTYPCSYPQANVLCVGATDNTDSRSGFSNWGRTSVDVFAPGEDLLSTYTGSGYAYLSGTSMATPVVAGIAALLAAQDPTDTAADLKAAILAGVDPKPLLAPRSVAGGRGNAARALGLTPDGGDGGGPGSEPGGSEGQGDDDPTPPPAPPATTTPADPPPTTAPEPAVSARIAAVRRTGSAILCRGGRCTHRSFALHFTLSQPALVDAAYERQICRRKACAWLTVARRSMTGRAGVNTLKIATKVGRRHLRAGRYRLTLSVQAAGGRASASTPFTIR